MLPPRQAIKAIRRRIEGFLTQGSRAREARRWAARRLRDDPVMLVVVERHMPHPFAPPFYRHWLDWLGERDPRFRSQIELHYLPTTPPPATRLLHSWVQDPVRERSESLFGQLIEVQESANSLGATVVQPVEVLSNSLRDRQFECLTRAGLRSPRLVPVGTDFASALGGLNLPVVVRPNWGHQVGMYRLDSPEQVTAWLNSIGDPDGWVASEYVEVRDPDGLYRKYRYILFGGHGVRRHVLTSRSWEVRPADRVLTDEALAHESEFIEGECDLHQELDRARREFGFDIAAFDYSYAEDGTPIVWEVNPYPDLSLPPAHLREHLAGSVERTFEAMTVFYRERLDAAVSAGP